LSLHDALPIWLRASHQALGSTDVPSGCDALPSRCRAPVSASRITTLQDCVEESIPATSVIFTERPSGVRVPTGLSERTRSCVRPLPEHQSLQNWHGQLEGQPLTRRPPAWG